MKHLCILILLFCLSCTKEVPPNVVVLFTDDQRFNTIHALGNEDIHTPNLDRLVQMGVSFTRAHVMGSHHGAVCAPSRAMLLSGKPFHSIPRDYIDMGRTTYETDFDFLTFPEFFKNQGYTTFFSGKWHNHSSKLRSGFDEAKNIFMGGMHWPKEGGHAQPWLWDQDETGKYAKADRWQAEAFSSKMFADAAIEFVGRQSTSHPFCMYVAFSSPHDPRMAPAEFTSLYDHAQIELPPNFAPQHAFDNGHLRTRDELLVSFPREPDTIIQEIKAYYAMVSEVDAQIGRLINTLQDKGILENTIIVFAGDNGLAVGQHGLLGKQNLYDHSVRVPLVIAAPGVAGFRQTNTLAYIHDIFPTLCELTGAEVPEDLEGMSLVPALKDESLSLRESVHLTHARQMRAIRTSDDWKLIQTFVNGTTHTQLFDLKKDPYEMTNLAPDTAWTRIQTDLTHDLTRHLIETKDAFFEPIIQSEFQAQGEPILVQILHPAGTTEVHYTLDGSEPSVQSPRYEQAFEITEQTIVKAAVFYGSEQIGEAVEVEIHIPQDVKEITWSLPPAPKYAADGTFSLIDGRRGSAVFRDGRWLGYEGQDCEVIIELEEERNLTRLGVGYLRKTGDWIFAPASIKIAVSNDGIHYRLVAETSLSSDATAKQGAFTFDQALSGDKARFIKYELNGVGECPDWHTGAGKKAWMFIDELIFE